ncbi:zinc finger protein 511-like [Lineus longissimus]|uniref:zinc finger protein 511-like n=1 Tax=Lineus longissimus TaxID=88925 RepID=UPI002B4D5D83
METDDLHGSTTLKEILPLKWTWSITKRRRPLDDPFFEEGNIVCNLEVNQWTVSEDIEEILQLSSVPEFSCHLSTCQKRFNSIAGYELHYNSEHRHTCSQCHRTFPNLHILDIHVLEWHDSMFQLLSQKQNMYECLREGCGKKFLTAKNRKNHLIKAHQYPANFRFDRPQQGGKKKKDAKQTTEQPVNENSHGDATPVEMDADVSKENVESVAMTADGDAEDAAPKSRFQYSYKVPKNICFGQGSQRGFQRPPGGKGKKHGRKKHWHQKQEDSMDTSVNIEKVDMNELADVLDSS